MEPFRRASSTTTLFKNLSSSDQYNYQGDTEHFKVYCEIPLGSVGANIAKAFLESCEMDYNKIASFFGGITPSNMPFRIFLGQFPQRPAGMMNVFHYSCEGTEIFVDIMDRANTNLNLIRYLAISQVVEVFSAAQFLKWGCYTIYGEALSRDIAAELYPNESAHYATSAYWLNSDRLNLINSNKYAYDDFAALGCSVLFLYYLRHQLNFSWGQIIANAADTLEETYAKLTRSEDGFLKFKDLLLKYFPLGNQFSGSIGNPFPIQTVI
jgi:hypothetical protein